MISLKKYRALIIGASGLGGVNCSKLLGHHVDYCEQHPEESYTKTLTSTKNIIKIAEKFKASIIYISTDYVFDGKSGPYDESATVNPISTYASHKLEAEQLVVNQSDHNLILRVTNVY